MKAPLLIPTIGAIAMTACAPALAVSDMVERYARAAVLAGSQSGALVLNESVQPHWTGRGGEFWYRRQTGDGVEYMLVLEKGNRNLAFDHSRSAAAIAAVTGKPASANSLVVESIEPGKRVVFTQEKQRVVCELPSYACIASPVPPNDPRQLLSPDGRHALFVREYDLWLRELSGTAERRLTSDGAAGFGWGAYPDGGLLSIPRQRHGGLPFPPYGFSWSPDGRFIVGARSDERATEPTYFLEAVPQDGTFLTKAWAVRQPMAGDAVAKGETAVFEAATGKRVLLSDSEIALDEPLGWSSDGKRFTAIGHTTEPRAILLLEVSVETGAMRTLLTERPSGFIDVNAQLYSAPNMRTVRNGSEVIWYSQRSGFGHLYRYRVADGKLLNAVTHGDWQVRDILHVDEARGRVVFTADGRGTANPYHRRVYRVNFDGSDLRLLGAENGDHQVDGPALAIIAKLLGTSSASEPVSPDGSVFVDTWSTCDEPPVTVLRSAEDGHIIAALEKADASRLLAAGWLAPLPFVAKAADGRADLYGVLYLPAGADLAAPRSLALVDAIYGGPQVTVTPHNFTDAWSGSRASRAAAMAALGFAAFVVDGRGTPLRSREFHDAAYAPNFADAGIDDHVAVVQQLAARFPMLDPERVGIFGHSFGGYASVRAMLRYPKVFKVGVSSAGIHSVQTTYSLTSILPPAVYAGGGSLRPTSQSIPENYRAMDNGSLASKLTGKLLLAYGDLDENAPFAGTAHLVDAFIKADRRFDLLYLPNRVHSFASEPYFQRRMWDYFVEHLLHETPPTLPAPTDLNRN